MIAQIVSLVRSLLAGRFSVKQTYREAIEVFKSTWFIVCLTGLFVGGILHFQVQYQLKPFNATSFWGGLSVSTIVRQIGPLLIAFLLSSKVGGSNSSELAFMKSTDQFLGYELLNVDLNYFLFVPKMVGVSLSAFFLFLIGLLFSTLGGYLYYMIAFDLPWSLYWAKVSLLIPVHSVYLGLIKSLIFGVVISVVSLLKGTHAEPSTEGIGKAVGASNQSSIFWILIINFILSQLFL